jgi:dihydropteroate synthase
MGIVNVSPDSFSGDGVASPHAAAQRAADQHAAGAHILDIGAESTRPGHTPIGEAEELRRLIPSIEAVRERLPNAAISVDTFKPNVLRAAHAAGADMLNSIWGIDDNLLDATLACAVPIVIMHNARSNEYQNGVVDEVLRSLERQAHHALRAGVPHDAIVLDPGIGFAKSAQQNIELLAALPRLTALGFPTLLGTSRKSTLGMLTGKPAGERVFGTAATVALGVAAGIDIMRVHDVAEMRDVVVVADAIVRGNGDRSAAP